MLSVLRMPIRLLHHVTLVIRGTLLYPLHHAVLTRFRCEGRQVSQRNVSVGGGDREVGRDVQLVLQLKMEAEYISDFS